MPMRTGVWNTCSASGTMPSSSAVPPVSTTPEPKPSSNPHWMIWLRVNDRISSTRASMIWLSMWRDSRRGGRPPTLGTSTICSRFTGARQRAAAAPLEQLGIAERRLQAGGNVAGDVVAAQRQHGGVLERALVEHQHVGGAGAEVDQRDAELLLLGRQHRFGGRQRLEHQVGDVQPGAFAALDDVLRRRRSPW